MYTVAEVAEKLRMSYRGVLLLMKQGRINFVMVGKQYLISQEEVDRVLKEGA